MVKGVNKTVIVVSDTGNEMFEKIVFYVTPKYSKTHLKELEQAAGEFSSSFVKTKNFKNTALRKRILKKKLLISGMVLSSIALLSLLAVLIF